MKQIEWTTEKRKISDITEFEKNPRILTKKQYEDLKKSLKKFNLAEIPAINKDNKLLAGHQRLRVLAELKGSDYEIDVRVPNRQLTPKEAEEYLIRSNKNSGEWDWDALANNFEMEELVSWGFDVDEFDIDLGDIEEEAEAEVKEPKKITCPACGEIFEK